MLALLLGSCPCVLHRMMSSSSSWFDFCCFGHLKPLHPSSAWSCQRDEVDKHNVSISGCFLVIGTPQTSLGH